MGRMDRVLAIDEAAGLARVQAGAFGPRTGGAAERRAAGRSATSPTASRTRRSAAGSRRARRACSPTSTATSPTSRARSRVVTPGGMLATRPVPSDLDRPERARDDPRQRGAARASSPRRPSTCTACRCERTILGYLFPNWAAALAAMREIAAAEAHPSVTRVSDANETALLVRDAQGADGARPRQVAGAAASSSSGGATSTSTRCASRSSATRAASATSRAQRKLVGRIVAPPRRPLHRQRPGSAVRPEEVRHAVHPRLPARPRRARRRVRDRRAVEPAAGGLRQR